MIIKLAQTEDEINGKAYVHHTAWQQAYTGLIDQAFLDGRTLALSQERAHRAFESGIPTLIAKDGDRVVGFADYGPYRQEGMEGTGEVYAIYILKEYYGTGTGRALMSRALEALRDYRQVAVWVLQGNERAIRFYQKCGFALDGAALTATLGTDVTELRMILRRQPFSQCVI